jgi:hypothetical protein
MDTEVFVTKKYTNREESFHAFYGSYYNEVKRIECEPDVIDVRNHCCYHVHRLIILSSVLNHCSFTLQVDVIYVNSP